MRPGLDPRKRRGGAVVEMAVVMPIFVLLIFGQIESSRLGMVAQFLTTAAREACRVAVVNDKSLVEVQTSLDDFLDSAGIPRQTITVVDSDPGTPGAWLSPANWRTPGNRSISVAVRVSYRSVSWIPTPYFLKTANVAGMATLSNERPSE